MMVMYVLFTLNPVGATYATAMHIVDGTKVLQDGYRMVMLDCRHWRHFVKMLRNEDGIEWVLALIRMG